ncbi:MAG TPA: TIGR04283 family arsenosugar biosynthesis glycosyltransferase [Nitrospiria bacterium]|jgi:rSAM/selenodomain-associated transferase 2|nr:TIGR04283 family arsenosugar biosynthesis glycosyltransferase [Nitrospiria bacterium]
MVPRISVIIPTLNEATVIEKTMAALSKRDGLERIVVDGHSSDDTRALAGPYADKVLLTEAGRGRQMNAGARAAAGEVFVFLHADSCLSDDAFRELIRALEDPDVLWGAFRLGIDSPRRILRLVAAAANWRTRLTGIPYGDQGIFVRRSVFEQSGGYPEIPIMEDLEFARRLKSLGKVKLLSRPIVTSSRRWDKEGAGYTTLRNQIYVVLYYLGVSPARLARCYRTVR